MENFLSENLCAHTDKLTHFKEYAVSHPHLVQVDMLLMRAIREPAGFAHLLVYGPSGVGKTTMIRQIAKRLNGSTPIPRSSNELSNHNGNTTSLPLLLIETRPPDGGVFNRADYYRTALKLLGEPFYERRVLVDIDAEQTWEKKGRGRTKTTQFNDSPELRHALEYAMTKRGVRVVILDEAQHLMKIGSGSSGGKLLDQLDWIKSMTNVTGVLHILIGTYELLNFCNLSGQVSRRGLDIHFPRYLFQHQQDRLEFQGVLLALLKQVPLDTEITELMQQWVYFYERSIGCVGVLKDWLIRAVAAALYDGSHTLTLERLHEHSLSLAQCERMALDATEGEQKLSYMESRREHLWHLLQMGMTSSEPTGTPVNSPSQTASKDTSIPSPVSTSSPSENNHKKRSTSPTSATVVTTNEAQTPVEPVSKKTTSTPSSSPTTATVAITNEAQTPVEPAPKKKQTRKKTAETPSLSPTTVTAATTNEVVSTTQQAEIPIEPAPKKKQTRKKTVEAPKTEIETAQPTDGFIFETVSEKTEPLPVEQSSSQKKSSRPVGQRKPQRDKVGD